MSIALQTAQTRYTTKAYDPARKIPAKTCARLMEVLRLTPSATNIQSWHFLIAALGYHAAHDPNAGKPKAQLGAERLFTRV